MTDPAPSRPPGPSANPAFEDLLILALERFEAEGAAGLEPFLAAHPAHSTLLRAHLQRLQRMGLAGGDGSAVTEHPQRLGEYRILAPLGHGGMGIVYRAMQESLGREVALKVIRPDQLFFPGARERFRREVALVARMHHPGIVPVYAVGSEEGVPFFAMELVRGATLADVIERLADRDPKALDGSDLDGALAECLGEARAEPPAALFAGEWHQVVLRIVREVAEALEHAHRRGVLHRDVKPSNIMVTRAGRVLLLDFGLAGDGGGERLTRTGSPLGSLAYMAPELLRGEPVPADVRCDVYSLGATCWELLALRLPYQSSDPVKLRELAGAGTRPRLATRNPRVTWDTETVVATAMDPDPARRYASASLLSRDLDNLLAHRPIEARDAGPWLRLRRWTQRHPARATAAAALLMALIGAPSLWAWEEGRARTRIEAQRDELARTNQDLHRARALADAESRRARGNFTKLQQAVDTMLTKVGDESLRDIPHMEAVRKDLLTEALHFYEGFLADTPDDPELRLEAARVRARTADVQALLGDYAAAREQVQRAIPQFSAAPDPDGSVALDLAHADRRLAAANRLLGDLPAAQTAIDAATSAWTAIAARSSTAATAMELGETRIEASLIAVDRGDLATALSVLTDSLQSIDTWSKAHADSKALLHLQARTLDHLAIARSQLAMQERDRASAVPRIERAIEEQTRAQELWRGLLAAAPGDAQMRGDAARSAISLGISLQLLDRLPAARDAMQRGIELFAALVTDFPAAQRRRCELANARGNLAAVLGGLGATKDSVQQSTAARDLWQALLQESPSNDEYAIGLSQSLQSLALGMWFSGTAVQDVLPLLEAAGAAADQALAVRPDNPSYRRVRRKVAETIAEASLAAADHVRAAAAARGLLEPRWAPTEPVLAAALLARAAGVAAVDPALPAADRERLRAAYHAEARELLAPAMAHGVTIEQLRARPDLAGQWSSPEFGALCDEVAPH